MNDEPIKINCSRCFGRYDVSDFPPFSTFNCPECGALLRVPKKFGRYFLEKLCGKGGMADIYRATDPLLLRRVAIKIAKSESEFGDMKERFFNEAKLIAPISHATVVPIYDCGVIGDESYLVMQYMDGGDLEFHLKQQNLPNLELLLGYLQDVTVGLHFLFLSHNIVHHDIKPGNIMLSSDGTAKICDFDFADRRRSGDMTTMCPLWGSPGYVSPERLRYGGEDHRGDIFSLGVTIYELLSGELPFGILGTPEELYQRRQQPFTPLLQLRPEIGKNISQLIDSMLDFNPGARPAYPEIIRILNW